MEIGNSNEIKDVHQDLKLIFNLQYQTMKNANKLPCCMLPILKKMFHIPKYFFNRQSLSLHVPSFLAEPYREQCASAALRGIAGSVRLVRVLCNDILCVRMNESAQSAHTYFVASVTLLSRGSSSCRLYIYKDFSKEHLVVIYQAKMLQNFLLKGAKNSITFQPF